MATMDRCPICDVSVRPENLIRHLNDIHPRHPVSPALPCIGGEGGGLYHWHTQLNIFSGATKFAIPASIGRSAFCLEPVHTHDSTGLIHIESDVNRLYSIGDFFAVWGKPFGSPSQMLVNGTAIPTPSPTVILYDQESIELHYASFA